MLEPELILFFVEPLERLAIPYMITGSVAGILYGEPRLTHDVDIVVELPRHRARELIAAFPDSDFYCPPEDVIVIEAGRSRRGHFNLIHHRSGFKADIYLVGDDPFHGWALKRVRRLKLESVEVAVAPPEYVILRKLEFFREGGSEKHIRDVKAMLELHGGMLDRTAIASWARVLGVEEIWNKLDGEGK